MKKILKEYSTLIILLGFFLLYLLYKRTNDMIVYLGANYILYISVTFFLVLSSLVCWKKGMFSSGRMLETLLIIMFCSYAASVLLLMPFNWLNVEFFSKSSHLESVRCEVTGISKRRMSRGMYIDVLGEQTFIRGFRPFFNLVENEQLEISDLEVKVKYRSGIFNSIILTELDLIRK
ncbi:hypothetical protein [Cyclobacterium marinum]|uniref:hypothetical protein n=1 Tax=Cyclobacterium marinum TaxID=104 RepID=UPI0011EEB742|nr:hypothetical protein [Cyclobacterium marinum]MBI0397962.1 hypothetical protein [Cyclobacterium marinum]